VTIDVEQIAGCLTMIDENLAVPFETTVLGVPVTVERLDLNHSEQIVAVAHWKQPSVAPPWAAGRRAMLHGLGDGELHKHLAAESRRRVVPTMVSERRATSLEVPKLSGERPVRQLAA
jgi:hypothetical protein